uniref:Uncharacterized protein n=1 Tax=Streptomyces rochei TaxID=1928 RepID=A0A068Q5U3_STRRO|nr:hypothetical protein [Streptomyces rochei]
MGFWRVVMAGEPMVLAVTDGSGEVRHREVRRMENPLTTLLLAGGQGVFRSPRALRCYSA